MANRTISIFVRFTEQGKRNTVPVTYIGNARLRPHPGGVYWVRWYERIRQRWKRVGSDPVDALKAQMRQEAALSGERMPAEESSPVSRATLAESIESFLLERSTQTDERGVARWRWELELFAKVCGKTYLSEIGRADVFAYWKHYQDKESAPRTCINRVQSLLTFLRNQGITGLLKPNEMPKYDEPAVDYYSREELRLLFAACDSEERIRYQTFLYTGMREREVMFLTWADVDLDAGTLTLQAKRGFSTKNRRPRLVPIPDVLVEALKTYKILYPSRPTIFVSSGGKPEGHFLGKLKDIVKRAGLPGKWNLHKFRRTFATMHLENGTPIQDLQSWIGHADLLTLRRYLANLDVKSHRARTMANNLAESVEA